MTLTYPHPDTQMTLAKIRHEVERDGSHWFEPATLRFFASRVSPAVYEGPGGCFFVSSERYRGSFTGPRRYTVRQYIPRSTRLRIEGDSMSDRATIETPDIPGRMNKWSGREGDGFMTFVTRDAAHRQARKMAQGQ